MARVRYVYAVLEQANSILDHAYAVSENVYAALEHAYSVLEQKGVLLTGTL